MLPDMERDVAVFTFGCFACVDFHVDLCLRCPSWVPGGGITGSWGDFSEDAAPFHSPPAVWGSSFSSSSHTGPCRLHGSSHLGGCGVCPAGFSLRFPVARLCTSLPLLVAISTCSLSSAVASRPCAPPTSSLAVGCRLSGAAASGQGLPDLRDPPQLESRGTGQVQGDLQAHLLLLDMGQHQTVLGWG